MDELQKSRNFLLSLNNANMCRTCLKPKSETNRLTRISTRDPEAEGVTIRDKIAKFLPDIDLKVIPNAAVCESCLTKINYIYERKTKWLQANERVLQEIDKMYSTFEE